MQGDLRDGDHFKFEVLEVRELDLVGSCVWELASDKFGNTEGGREVQGRKRHQGPRWSLIAINEFKFVQSRAASEHGMQ
jgi:hypothetical protein